MALTALVTLSGCTSPQPVTMAPPVPSQPGMVLNAPGASGPIGNGGISAPQPATNTNAGVFNWTDTPVNQRIPVVRAVFDQGGYQIFAQSGETIVVPFVNQNLYAMKFGQSGGGDMYFINDGNAPTLYLPSGGYLENAAAQGARWFPFSQNFNYSQPVYIGLAPSWADYMAMGWYSGMLYHGGYWGYRPWAPGFGYTPMIGLNFNIGGRPYYGWDSYHSYYRTNSYNRVSVNSRPAFNYSSVGRRPGGSSFSANGGARRSTGSFGGGSAATSSRNPNYNGSFGGARPQSGATGSFGGSRNTFGTAPNRPGGSFGGGGTSAAAPGPSGAFGRSGGSFGGGNGGFGTSSSSSSGYNSSGRSRGSFGSGSSGYSRPSGSFGGGSFGSGSGGSFGRSSGSSSSGSSGFGRSSGSSGGSFGRSSGGSFGRSSGGGSFGRSSGGGGRRR